MATFFRSDSIENRYLCKDGTYRWIEWRSKAIESTIYAVARDVTDRRRLEDELRESEGLNKSIVKAVPDIIFRLNRSGAFLDVITPNEGLPLVPKEAILGKTAADILPADAAEIAMHATEQAFCTNTLQTCEYSLSMPKGVEYFEARIVPVDETTAYSLVRDITDRKQAEAKLAEYTMELELRGVEMDRLYNALDAEIQNARQAHQRLVQQCLPRPKGISLAADHSPASYIGGDFFHAIQRDELLIVYLTDITGHGLEGTIFGLFVKGCIEAYLDLAPKSDIVPDKVLAYLDEQVHKGGYPSEYAVAIFLLIVNIETREDSFSSAGFHNPPVLVHGNGFTEMLVSRGLPISPDIPLGVMEFEHHTVSIPENSFLFLATDGIYEQLQGDEMYEQRLLRLLKQCAGLPHGTVKDLVNKDFRDFLGDRPQADDVTFVVLSTQRMTEYAFPSSWGSLDTARDHALSYFTDHPECDSIVMAVHELVANAIEHGNQCDADKNVTVLLSDRAVVFEDEGDGFDWRARTSSELCLDLGQERGRGIAMTQLLAGQLVYNQKGNRVSLLLDGLGSELPRAPA